MGHAVVLRALDRDTALQVVEWRRACPEALRTPYEITREQQEQWYRDVVCDRRAASRYWAAWAGDDLVGFAGLEGIQWENGLAEISLLVAPGQRGKGFGKLIVGAVLEQAFNRLRLHQVVGESYECAAAGWWRKLGTERGWYMTELPARKYWAGQWWASLYFAIESPVS